MIEDLEMTDSIGETGERLFIEDFDTWDMTGYYLYSKLLRSGVSGHIGTWGSSATRSVAERAFDSVRDSVLVVDARIKHLPVVLANVPRAAASGPGPSRLKARH